MQRLNKNKSLLILFTLLILGFFYRIYGLLANYSFWNDEENVATFARAILQRGYPVLGNGYSTGVYNWLQYWLSAGSAKFFGLNEFAVRFPSVIFGVLTIWAIYLLGKELFNKKVGLISAFFVTFLKIEILWSRQARPYQSLQLFYLLGAYFLYRLVKTEKFNRNYFVGFLVVGILASLMHGLGIFLFLWGFAYLLVMKFSWFKKRWFLILPIFLILGVFSYFLRGKIVSTLGLFGKFNNLYYYRVFLTHNYLLISLLAFLGGLALLFKKKFKKATLFIIFVGFQIILASWFLPQPFTRYLYIVFPFIILLSGYFLWFLSKFVKKRPLSLIVLIFLIFMTIFLSKDKFALFPQNSYSLNADMQEVPEVDYKKLYAFVKPKLEDNPEAIFISNWFDHPIWYLGEGGLDYWLRVKDFPSQTKDAFSGAIFIDSLNSLKEIISKEKKGIIILESWESHLPKGIGEYIRLNLKKEFEWDRLYPIQPRYWPVEVYSWGIDK